MYCINCSKETTNPKFCSRSCAAKFNNRKFPKRKIESKCRNCDNKIRKSNTTLCFSCYKNYCQRFYKSKTVGEYRNKLSVRDKHPSWLNVHVRSFARSWLKYKTDMPCHNCGYDKHVELCHIKPISSFSDNTKLSEINSHDNVIQLCRNCHWEFDNGILDLAFPEFDYLHS